MPLSYDAKEIASVKGVPPEKFISGMYQYIYDVDFMKSCESLNVLRTVNVDSVSQKYLENLNKKSIKKLTRREDGYEILKNKIENSNFSDSQKKYFDGELQKIFGTYFTK